jgi:hypothetical protein
MNKPWVKPYDAYLTALLLGAQFRKEQSRRDRENLDAMDTKIDPTKGIG